MVDPLTLLHERQQVLLGHIAAARNADLGYPSFLASVNSVLLDHLAETILDRFDKTIGLASFRADSREVRSANLNKILVSLQIDHAVDISDFLWILEWLEANIVSHARKPIPLHIKWQLLAREYRCAYPGCSSVTALEIDHFVPVARGGGGDLANLRWLCRHHNASKGARRPTPEI